MNQAETNRFNKLYKRHLRLLKLQGKSKKTIRLNTFRRGNPVREPRPEVDNHLFHLGSEQTGDRRYPTAKETKPEETDSRKSEH